MRWRTPLAVLLGLLLPLPLVWVLLRTTPDAGGLGAPIPRTIPMLPLEERRGLTTYERPCQSREDCEAPLECFLNTRSMERYCTDSTCMTDAHCPEGFVCRAMPLGREGPAIRLCTLEGTRQEGEACDALPRTPREGCERGLLCQGWCGRPCRRDEPTSCPVGFFCAEGPNGSSCLPSCEGRSCPEGQQCVSLGKRGVSVCARVHGEDCQRTSSCPDGQQCLVNHAPHRPGEVWMRCAARCGGDEPPCPEGLVCHVFRCRQPCEPELPDACGPHHHCHRDADSEPWLCRPDYHAL
jgi:hypothetical protein